MKDGANNSFTAIKVTGLNLILYFLLKYFLELYKFQLTLLMKPLILPDVVGLRKPGCGLSSSIVYVNYLRLLNFLPIGCLFITFSHITYTFIHTHYFSIPLHLTLSSHNITTFYLRKDSKSPGVAVRPAA